MLFKQPIPFLKIFLRKWFNSNKYIKMFMAPFLIFWKSPPKAHHYRKTLTNYHTSRERLCSCVKMGKCLWHNTVCVHTQVLSCSVMSDSSRPCGLWPSMLLCPCEFFRQGHWNGLPFPPPEKSSWPTDWTHVSCVSCLCRRIFYLLSHWGSPYLA